eukprot:gene7825-5629_t
MWFLHSVVAEVDTSRYSLHLSVGCMPLKQRDSQRLHVDSYAMQLLAGLLPCSYLHDIPGFEKDNNDTRFKFSVTYPNVRRMLMLQGLAETRRWDVIVYADVDAFFVRNPLPELLRLYETGRYAAAFQRDEYNSSERICNGLWAMFDMRLPRHIAEHGGYGQAQINDWIRGRMIDEFVSKPTAYRTELSFVSQSVVSKEEYRWRLYLLPEPQFYRGTCGSVPPASGSVLVSHCHSTYFRAYEKELDLRKEKLLLPFGSIPNVAYGFVPTGAPQLTSVNASQILQEVTVLLHAMNQSIASLCAHAGALLQTYRIVSVAAHGLNRVASTISTESAPDDTHQTSRNLRGTRVPFRSTQASHPLIEPHETTFNQVNNFVGPIIVTRNPTLPTTTTAEWHPQLPDDGIRDELLRQGHQLTQPHLQNLPHGLSSRTARSQTPPRVTQPRDPSVTHINVRPQRSSATGNAPTKAGSSPQIKRSVAYQGNNYVPLPLSLPPSLHTMLVTSVFPSDSIHRHRIATDVDGYFMRDLSLVANKYYGRSYHIDLLIQDIAGPFSTTELRRAIEAMTGWQAMSNRYGITSLP